MRFTFEGVDYDFDENKLSLLEADLLKRHGKLTPKKFYMGITEMDPDAVRGVVFLAKVRNGEPPRWPKHLPEDQNLLEFFEIEAAGDGDPADDTDEDEYELDPTN